MPSPGEWKQETMHRRLILRAGLLSLLAFLMIACTGGQRETGPTLRQGVVERGSLDEVVSATGTVLAEERVNLGFEQSGVVDQVFVEVGDRVEAGERLATLDTERLELAVQQATLSLQTQQLNYDRLFQPPSPADIAAAQAAVDSARASYQREAEGADPETVRVAQLQYEQAFNAYIQADMELRAVQWYLPESELLSLRERVDQALTQVEVARLQLEQARSGPDDLTLAASLASVRQAEAELNRLLEGPSDLEVARAELLVEQAQLALDRARQNLEAATLRAPFSGVVAQVNVHPGMPPPANNPAIVLVDDSRLHVEVDVDEMDVGRVVVGQPVYITVDALPGEVLQGQVSNVAPAATLSGGAVTYRTRIDLVPSDLAIRSGMTATADIVVQHLEDVLLVPNWAVRFDRTTGQAFASILGEDGSPQEVPVVLGLRGDTVSQVLAGLEEGQVVAVSLESEQFSFFGNGEE